MFLSSPLMYNLVACVYRILLCLLVSCSATFLFDSGYIVFVCCVHNFALGFIYFSTDISGFSQNLLCIANEFMLMFSKSRICRGSGHF